MVLYMYQIGFIFSIFKHIIIPKTCNSSLEGVSEASSFKEPTTSIISPKIVSFSQILILVLNLDHMISLWRKNLNSSPFPSHLSFISLMTS